MSAARRPRGRAGPPPARTSSPAPAPALAPAPDPATGLAGSVVALARPPLGLSAALFVAVLFPGSRAPRVYVGAAAAALVALK
ncbi:hypothetical protein JKP88DRAFT_272178 [Tribonema minus]|uniref:Uncharacterized protein n=1 Tax=Tribonema minus TaxID=303371 RepID=A0A836CPK5_9STRA|nr:hypothetical protein JKP88DRAFT_272178 [Tribonema minus]